VLAALDAGDDVDVRPAVAVEVHDADRRPHRRDDRRDVRQLLVQLARRLVLEVDATPLGALGQVEAVVAQRLGGALVLGLRAGVGGEKPGGCGLAGGAIPVGAPPGGSAVVRAPSPPVWGRGVRGEGASLVSIPLTPGPSPPNTEARGVMMVSGGSRAGPSRN